MRIDSSGNVIVKAGKELRLNRPDDATYGAISHGVSGTGIVYNDLNGDGHHWQFAGAEKMRLDASGNVGIGVTPQTDWTATITALQIGPQSVFRAGATEYTDATFMGTNVKQISGTNKYIETGAATEYYQQGGVHFWNYAASGTAGNTISFSEAMRIDSSGHLLVGKSTSAFGTQGIELQSDGELIATKNGTPIYVNRITTDGAMQNFYKDGSAVGSIGTAGGALYIGSTTGNDSYLAFYGDVIIPSTSAGLNRDNAIDLGYSSSRFKDLYLSGGVYLGGTGAANKLDDYEEGTWTPALSFDGANVGTTYNSRYGRYTKTGNLVSLSGYFFLSNKGTSTGSARFDNLPFAALSETGNYVSVTFWAASVTNSGSLQGYVALGQTFVQLQEVSGVGTNSNLTQADFANNSEVMIQVSYYTSS